MLKRIFSLFLTLAMMLAFLPVSVTAEEGTVPDVTILYTNDVHGAIEGYSTLAGYRKALENQGHHVLLVDAGDSIQGELVDQLTKGEASVVTMGTAGYDLAIPGNHEFDYKVPRFLELAEMAKFPYICANFKDLKADKLLFDGYKTFEVSGHKIAFVGIDTPETYTKSTPTYFMDENRKYIYSFMEDSLYETIQAAIDEAKAQNPEVLVAIGHTGMEGSKDGWKTSDIIANTTGIDAYIDGHSHEEIPGPDYLGEVFKNKDGKEVIETSTGTKLKNIGKMEITFKEDGPEIKTSLVSLDDAKAAVKADPEAVKEAERVEGAEDQEGTLQYYLKEVKKFETAPVAKNEADLYILHPETEQRIIRSQETNLGDLVADAYRATLKCDVTIANGGGIRKNLPKGDITLKNLADVNPFGNNMGVVKVKGQVILDALEHAARKLPSENGGFMHVSGMSYVIDPSIPSPVVEGSDGAFDHIDDSKPRRVSDVKVGAEMLDPEKEYTLGGSTYLLFDAGDGMNMFRDLEVVMRDIRVDYELVIAYVTDEEMLNGVIPADDYSDYHGQGRILILSEGDVKMYRVYNPNSGEHFYTANEKEKDALVELGWQYEGVGWKAPGEGTPVYRLYNKYGGEHHYTMNEKEKDALVKLGWTDEGIGWNSADENGRPVYRDYNPNAHANNHNYTANKKEHTALIGFGWNDESIGWYAAY